MKWKREISEEKTEWINKEYCEKMGGKGKVYISGPRTGLVDTVDSSIPSVITDSRRCRCKLWLFLRFSSNVPESSAIMTIEKAYLWQHAGVSYRWIFSTSLGGWRALTIHTKWDEKCGRKRVKTGNKIEPQGGQRGGGTWVRGNCFFVWIWCISLHFDGVLNY